MLWEAIMRDYEELDEFYDDYDEELDGEEDEEELYDADWDDDLSPAEKDALQRKVLGTLILTQSTPEELNDIYYLEKIVHNYGVSLKSAMSYASEDLADLFDVGNVYLSPLFKNDSDKEKYIIKKLKKWKDYNGDKRIKYDEKLILVKVYHTSPKYAKFAVRFLYTKDDCEKIPLKVKFRDLFAKIKFKLNSSNFMTKEEIEHFKKLYDDVLNGARATNLNWLLHKNQQKVKSYAEDMIDEDDDCNTMAMYVTTEDIEIMYYVALANKILSQKSLTINDKAKLEEIFSNLNNFVILARNEQQAEFDKGGGNSQSL